MLLSRLDRAFRFTPRSIVEHGQVISHVFETHTVLPMKFGTFFSSEKQIEQLVRENQEELLETFCRLRGKAEMRLKLSFPLPLAWVEGSARKPPQGSWPVRRHPWDGGAMPLEPETKLSAELAVAKVHEIFRPLEEQIHCRQFLGKELVVDCAHLIEQTRVPAYQRLSQIASEQIKECAIRSSGPWPPYHFLPASVRLPSARLSAPKPRVAVAMR